MQNALIERAWVDLDVVSPYAPRITHLTDAAEPRWTGVIDLGPSDTFSLEDGLRYDFYLLHGSVEIEGHTFSADDFLIQRDSTVMQAGEEGARLLAYREAGDGSHHRLERLAKGRKWRTGINPQMEVATLDGGPHQISLVSWLPGAQTRLHSHPRGEEMFVLSGEISDGENRYPSGTWLRFHPGSTHAPSALVPATILLRHGHLTSP